MRVGKKPNVVEAKKTRSCVVRLEKFSKTSTNVSPSTEEKRINRLNTTAIMGATPKGRRTGANAAASSASHHEAEKSNNAPIKKRIVGGSTTNLSMQTPQQKSSSSTTTITNIRSNQKIKIIPRSNKSTPASTPSRDETPPPTIAAGRSRRAIKPNPKYASEDLVTPKVVRNVATLGSTNRGAGQAGKTRKNSTSSDDFYNRNSEDEFEKNMNEEQTEDDVDDDDDLLNDKAYQVNEKDENDSDYSVLDELPARSLKSRGRPKRATQDFSANNLTTPSSNKLATQAANSSNSASNQVKRSAASAQHNSSSSSNLRSAPSQLQQIRRSLATANAQRNLNMLAGSGATAQKRKLEDIQDSSDNESSYTISRKQILLSQAGGVKVKVPVRENSKINATSTPLTKNRVNTPATAQQQQTVNGSTSRINSTQTTANRRAAEMATKSNVDSNNSKPAQRQTSSSSSSLQHQNAKTNQPHTQAKLLSSKVNRLRSGSPKLPTLKDKQNSSTISQSASSISTSTSDKTKAPGTQTKSTPNAINTENVLDIKDDSPNSTIDDFETMPTFTIVNVNDIINKKGDVLITKSKTNNNKTPTVIEFSESISLDDDDEMEDNRDADNEDEGAKEIKVKTKSNAATAKQNAGRKLTNNNNKLLTLNNRKEFDNKKSPLNRSNESLKKLNTSTTTANNTKTNSTPAPQILNHKLGLRNANKTAKATTTLTATLKSPDKPAPRILNSMVAKKTQPVKPMIANMDDSADESFPLSLDEDEEDEEEHEEEEETEDEVESRGNRGHLMQTRKRQQKQRQNIMEMDNDDTESQNTEDDEIMLQATNNNNNKTTSNKTSSSAAAAAGALTPKQNQHIATQRRRRAAAVSNTPIVVSSNKKRLTPAASASTKENSLAATNQQVKHDTTPAATKTNSNTPAALPPPPTAARKVPAEKVVISKLGDKIIKRITCFETWHVINMPLEPKRPTVIKNQLEMPLIRLANNAKNICLPNDLWSSKVTLYELSPQTLGKGTFVTYTGDLYEHNINEEDRGKYQPSCVMFRRSVEKNQITRMPYDRAVIFKNKTFYTNIEGKNVRLVGAPSIISTESEIEILLEVVDSLTLQSDFVEHISIVQ